MRPIAPRSAAAECATFAPLDERSSRARVGQVLERLEDRAAQPCRTVPDLHGWSGRRARPRAPVDLSLESWKVASPSPRRRAATRLTPHVYQPRVGPSSYVIAAIRSSSGCWPTPTSPARWRRARRHGRARLAPDAADQLRRDVGALTPQAVLKLVNGELRPEGEAIVAVGPRDRVEKMFAGAGLGAAMVEMSQP